MISQGTLAVVLWGAYAWFVVGVVLIAVPAIKELAGILFKKRPPGTGGVERARTTRRTGG